MDRVRELRRHDGLHGISLQWGTIRDMGLVAETLVGGNDVVLGRTIPQPFYALLDACDDLFIPLNEDGLM